MNGTIWELLTSFQVVENIQMGLDLLRFTKYTSSYDSTSPLFLLLLVKRPVMFINAEKKKWIC